MNRERDARTPKKRFLPNWDAPGETRSYGNFGQHDRLFSSY
jgi:hypothetical protein